MPIIIRAENKSRVSWLNPFRRFAVNWHAKRISREWERSYQARYNSNTINLGRLPQEMNMDVGRSRDYLLSHGITQITLNTRSSMWSYCSAGNGFIEALQSGISAARRSGIVIRAEYQNNISWLRHPIRRYRVNWHTKKVAREWNTNHRADSKTNVIDIQSAPAALDAAVKASLDFLENQGVKQIQVQTNLPFWSYCTAEGFVEAIHSGLALLKKTVLMQIAPRGDGDFSGPRMITYLETDGGQPLRYNHGTNSTANGTLTRTTDIHLAYTHPALPPLPAGQETFKDSFQFIETFQNGATRVITVNVSVQRPGNNNAIPHYRYLDAQTIELYVPEGERATITLPLKQVPFDAYFGPDIEVDARNINLVDNTYRLTGLAGHARNSNDHQPYFGDASLFRVAAVAREWDNELAMVDGKLVPLDELPELKAAFPDAIIKDETKPNNILALAAGGLYGAINFGVRRLYDLVMTNITQLRGFIAEVNRDEFTIVMGKADRYIRFFGTPTVGQQSLAEFTTEQKPHQDDFGTIEAYREATVEWEKKRQCMLVTQPISTARAQELLTSDEPIPLVMENLETGKIKYYLYNKSLQGHITKILISLQLKSGFAFTAEEILPELAQLRQDQQITPEQEAQLQVLESQLNQPDAQTTQWAFREPVPGAMVVSKGFIDRYNNVMQRLEKKYPEAAPLLRDWGNRYTLGELIFFSMLSKSDRGTEISGAVGLFKDIKPLNQKYIRELYDAIRTEVYLGKSWYSIDIGPSAEVVSFSDQRAGQDGRRIGEAAYTRIMKAIVTDTAIISDEQCTEWRMALGLPYEKRLGIFAQPVVLGSNVRDLATYTWRYRYRDLFRRNTVIISSDLGENFLLGKKGTVIIGARHDAKSPTRLQGDFFSIFSEGQIPTGLAARGEGTLAYHVDDLGGTAAAFSASQAYPNGLMAMFIGKEALDGTGRHPDRRREETTMPERSVVGKEAAESRKQMVARHIGDLAPDLNARREEMLLRKILSRLGRGNS